MSLLIKMAYCMVFPLILIHIQHFRQVSKNFVLLPLAIEKEIPLEFDFQVDSPCTKNTLSIYLGNSSDMVYAVKLDCDDMLSTLSTTDINNNNNVESKKMLYSYLQDFFQRKK